MCVGGSAFRHKSRCFFIEKNISSSLVQFISTSFQCYLKSIITNGAKTEKHSKWSRSMARDKCIKAVTRSLETLVFSRLRPIPVYSTP